MKKITIFTVLPICFIFSHAQVDAQNSIPIQHDTATQWVAECDKVVNLSPKANEYSLKKWYLKKLKTSSVTAYKKNAGNDSVSSYTLSMPQLQTQDWLKGLSIELSPTKHPQEWYFTDKTIPGNEGVKYRVGKLNLAADSCCGCDDADAFRAKQVLSYKSGKFSIHNVFISPLCVRRTDATPSDWYPLCNVAYNNNPERQFPGLSMDIVFLNTNEVEYDFNTDNPSGYDSVYTAYRTDIGNLIYQDILKGRLKAVETETGKVIPVKNILTIGMPRDTMAVYDLDEPGKISAFRVVQSERNPRDFNRIRIRQDLYFDFRNERLYSVIRSVLIIMPIRMYDGTIRGYTPFCRIY